MVRKIRTLLSTRVLLAIALGWSIMPRLARAQGADAEVRGLEFAAAVNLVKKNVKVEGTLFLPEKAGRARSVLVVINWGLGQEVYEDPQWLKLSETLESGLLLAKISNIGPPDPNEPQRVIRNASVGGADGLVMLLQRLAVESGHQELERTPVLVWGHSAAGSFATTFALAHPQRTIAFIRYHSHRRGQPLDLKVLSQTPALLIAGGKDGTAGVEDSESLWQGGRAAGAPWTFAVEPAATHGSEESMRKANDLMIPWIKAVLGQRVSPSHPSLRAVNERGAWMGNQRTGAVTPDAAFSGSRQEASWLPDEPSSRGWQAVRASGSSPAQSK